MKKIIKIILILFILLISICLYFPNFYEKNLIYEKEDCCNVTIDLSKTNFDEPSIINTLKKITSPFELKYYDIYLTILSTNDSLLVYPVNVSYTLDGKTKKINININQSSFVDTLRVDEPHTLYFSDISYQISKDFKSGEYIFTAGEELIYFPVARMNWYDSMGNIFIFSIFWVGFLLLIISIYEWIIKKEHKNF